MAVDNRQAVVINLLNFVDSQLTGAGFFARNILSNWLIGAEHFVTIYHSSAVNPEELFQLPQNPNIRKKKVAISNFLLRIAYEQLILPFKLRPYRIYFCPNPVFLFLAKIVSPHTKIFITIHDMIPFHVSDKYGFFRNFYVKLISKYGARYADHIITVSENSKDDIGRIANVLPEKITVLYNFFPYVFEKSIRDERYFLTISTIEPGKNIETTIKAFAKFIDLYKMPDFKFYWLGKIGWGYTQEELTGLIAQHGLQNNFFLMGYVSHEKKNQMLNDCTAMVYLSHYEGFGLPVLEGLFFNKPSVASNASSLPEVVGKAGILCDKNDIDEIAAAFHRVIVDREMYQEYIPEQLSKFDRENQMRKFFQLINGC